jgi:hypothetical protein
MVWKLPHTSQEKVITSRNTQWFFFEEVKFETLVFDTQLFEVSSTQPE